MKKKPFYFRALKFIFPLVEKFDRDTYGKMSDKELLWKWYLPQIALWSLFPGALLYLFHPLLNPDVTLFSNDGPIGVMNSNWVRDGYPPGQPLWNDLWWLGSGSGRSPLMITNFIYWIGNNPILVFATLNIIAVIVFYALRNRYNQSLLPYEPERREDNPSLSNPPVDKSTAVLLHRLIFMCMFSRFFWIYFATLDKPWDIKDVLFPLEGLILMGYLFLGLVFWFSDEMEHLDYKRICSERSSK